MANSKKTTPAHLRYQTQYTKMMREGKKEPTRSMFNKKAAEKQYRRQRWENQKNA